MRTSAIVLAGGEIPDREASFREATGVRCKSLVPLGGRIMVSHVVEALRASSRIDEIVVVGPPELADHPDLAGRCRVLREAEGRSENLFLALEACPSAERCVMLTSDTPLVTGAMVDEALEAFGDDTDLGYVLVPYPLVMERFGDRPPPPPDERGRTMPNWVSVRLREGRFTGTATLLFRPSAIDKLRPLIKGVFDDREIGNVVRVLRGVLGLALLVRVALALRFPGIGGLISIRGIERRLGRSLSLRPRAWIAPHPEMAFDVDHITDVPIAEAVLAERR